MPGLLVALWLAVQMTPRTTPAATPLRFAPVAPGPDDILPLEVRHYGEQPRDMLHDDDGETLAYERGERTWTRLTVARDVTGAWRGTVTPDPNGRRWRYSDVKWTFMTAR